MVALSKSVWRQIDTTVYSASNPLTYWAIFWIYYLYVLFYNIMDWTHNNFTDKSITRFTYLSLEILIGEGKKKELLIIT
jgi:hypothetical protein